MSDAVDSRIVQMVFENGKFEKNIHETIESLKQLQDALEMDDSIKQLTELEKAEAQSAQATEKHVKTGIDAISTFSLMVYKVKNDVASYFVEMGKSALNFGKQLASTLTTMDQWRQGFNKYEEKTKAVQTIRSALPDVDFSVINDALDELNWYSDMTSYSFNEMTSSLGKFVAAGIDLDTAVMAIEGINNEAAKSGASIAQANAAMYNFSQALSTGSVKLIDWKSIENATMATREFKEQIIDTAVEMGELKRRGDKIFTKKGTEIDFQNFSSTLSQGWFTSDVLMEVLKRYSDLDTEFGQTAFEAARVSRTFSDAWLAIKDATSTGWMTSFELIFGNLEEACELWTTWGDAVIDATAGISDWRNEILQGWRDLGGREALISGLEGVFTGLWNILVEVKNAFADVFPVDFSTMLANMSDNIQKFGERFEWIFGYRTRFVQTTQQVVADGSHLMHEFNGEMLELGSSGEQVKKLQEYLNELGYNLSVDGIFGKKTQAALIEFQNSVASTVESVFVLSRTDFGIGDAGKEVADLQKRLIELGYLTEEQASEGVFNLETRAAFNEYRNSIDYVMDCQHELGERGDDIRAMQEELIAAGFLTDESGADGIYGPKTKAALEAYRHDASDAIEGVYDEATHKNLMEALDSKEGIQSYVEKTVMAPVEELGIGLQTVRTIATGILSVFSIIAKVVGAVLHVALTGLGYVLQLLNPVLTLFVDVLTAVSNALTVGDQLLTEGGLFEGIVTALSTAFGWLQGKIESAVGAVRRFLGLEGEIDENGNAIFTIKTLWDNFVNTLRETGALDALITAWNAVKQAFSDVKDKIAEVFTGNASEAWEGVKNVLLTVAQVLGGILAVVLMGLAKLVQLVVPLIGKLPKAFKAVKNFVTNIWKQFGISERITKFSKRVGNFGKSIYEFFFGKDEELHPGSVMTKHVNGLIDNISSWVTGVWDKYKIGEKIQNGFKHVKSFAKSVSDFFFGKNVEHDEMANPEERYTEHIAGFFENAWKWLHESEAVQNFIDGAKNVAKSVWQFFFGKDEETENGETEHTAGLFENIGTWISDAWKWLHESEAVQSFIDGAKSVAVSVWEYFFGKNEETESGETEHTAGLFERIGAWIADAWTWLNESEAIQNYIDSAKNFAKSVREFFFGKNIEHDEMANPEERFTEHIPGFFDKVWAWVSDGERLQRIADTAKSVVQSIREFLFGKDIEHGDMTMANPEERGSEHISGLFERINSWFDSVSETIEKSEVLNGLIDRLKDTWESVKTFFKEGKLEDLPGVIGEGIGGVFGQVIDWFSGIGDSIKDSEAVQGFLDKLKEIWDAIKNFFLNDVPEIPENVANGAKVTFQTIVDWAVWLGTKIGEIASAFANGVIKGLNRLIPIMGAAAVLMSAIAVNNFAKAIKNLTKASKIRAKAENNNMKARKWAMIAMTIKEIVDAMIVIFLAIHYLANVKDPDKITYGLKVIGVIAGALLAFLVLFGVAARFKLIDTKAFEGLGHAMLGLAAALAVMLIAIDLFSKMRFSTLISGVAKLALVMIVLAAFMKSIGKSKPKSDLKGIYQIAVILLAMVAAVAILGQLPVKVIAKGIVAVALLSLLIRGLMKTVGKYKPNGKVRYVIAIALLFAAFAAMTAFLGFLDTKTLIKGLIGMLAIVVSLKAMLNGLKKISNIKLNRSAILGLLVLIAGIAGLIYAISYSLNKAKDISDKQMLAFAKVLLAAVAMVRAVLKPLKDVSKFKGASIGALAAIFVGIAGLMVALGWALSMVKDVSSDKIAAFALPILAMARVTRAVMSQLQNLKGIKFSTVLSLALPLFAVAAMALAVGVAANLAQNTSPAQIAALTLPLLAMVRVTKAVTKELQSLKGLKSGDILSLGMPLFMVAAMAFAVGVAANFAQSTSSAQIAALTLPLLAMVRVTKAVTKELQSLKGLKASNLLSLAAPLFMVAAMAFAVGVAANFAQNTSPAQIAAMALPILAMARVTKNVTKELASLKELNWSQLASLAAPLFMVAGMVVALGYALSLAQNTSATQIAAMALPILAMARVTKNVMKELGTLKKGTGATPAQIAALAAPLFMVVAMVAALGVALSLAQNTSATQIAAMALPILAMARITKNVMKELRVLQSTGATPKQLASIAAPLFAIAGMVAALGFALRLAQGVSTAQIVAFCAPLLVMALMAHIVMRSLETVKTVNEKQLIKMAAPLFAIAGMVVALGFALWLIKDVPGDKIIAFMLPMIALIPLMIAFFVGLKLLTETSTISPAKLAALALPLLAFGAILVAMGYAMKLSSAMTVAQMEKFAAVVAALGVAFVGLGVFFGLLAHAGPGAMQGVLAGLVALVGVILVFGLLVAAIGGLTSMPGFNQVMGRGMEKLGEGFGKMVGAFRGAMQASQLKALANGVSALGNVKPVDESKVNGILSISQLLVDFEKGMPEKDNLTKLTEWITGGGPLAQLGKDMGKFAEGFNTFATELSKVDSSLDDGTLETRTKAAISIAKQLSTFEEGLPELTIGEALINLIAGGSPLERLATDIAAFGAGFNSFAKEMLQVETVEGLEEKTDTAVTIAQQISKLREGMTFETVAVDALLELLGLDSPIARLSSDLGDFASGFNNFATIMSGIEDVTGLEEKTNTAVTIAQQIVNLKNGLNVSTVILDALLEKLGAQGPIARLATDMGDFAAGFNNFATVMSEVETPEGLEEKTTSAVTIAGQIAALKNGLPAAETVFTELVTTWLGVDGPIASLMTDMGDFAGGFNTFVSKMKEVNTPEGLEEKVQSAVTIAGQIAALKTGMPAAKTVVTELAEKWLNVDGPIASLMTDLGDFAGGFNSFVEKMSLVNDPGEVEQKVNDAVAITNQIVALKNGMSLSKTVLETFAKNYLGTEGVMSTTMKDLGDFASGFNAFATQMSAVDMPEGFEEKTDSAVKIAEQIVALRNALPTSSYVLTSLLSFIGTEGPLAEFADDMGNFATGMGNFATEMMKVPDNIASDEFKSKSATAVEIATSIADLQNAVSGGTSDFQAFLGFFGGNSFDQFLAQLPTFAGQVGTFVDDIKTISISDEDKEKAEKATEVASVVAEFMSALSGSQIQGDRSAFEKFFTGETNINTFFSKIGDLATNVDTLKTSFVGFTEAGVEEEWKSIKRTMDAFLEFVVGLSQDANGVAKKSINTANFDTLITKLYDLLSMINMFYQNAGEYGTDTSAFTSMITGVSSFVDTVSNVSGESIDEGLATIDERKSEFVTVGGNLIGGLVQGLTDGQSSVVNAIIKIADAAINEAKSKFKIKSPSRVFAEIGQYIDLGMEKGLRSEEDTVVSAMKDQCAEITDLFTSMDLDPPVIRPVLDLSDVSSAAKGIDPLIGGGRSIDVSATATRTREATEAGRSRTVHNNQNGNSTSSQEAGGSVLITGNSFNIQNESDIDVLASKIAALLHSQQRGYGAAL